MKKQSPIKRVKLAQFISFSPKFTPQRFNSLIHALDLMVAQTHEIAEIYTELDEKGLDLDAAANFLDTLGNLLDGRFADISESLQKKLIQALKLRPHLEATDQVKVSIPILAHLLRYESESDAQPLASPMWLDLRNGLIFMQIATRGGWTDDINASAKTAVRVVAGITIYKTPAGNFQYTSGAAICVDGAPNAYAPNDGGSDATAAAGHNQGDVRTYKKGSNGKFLLMGEEKVPDTFYEDTAWWGVVTGADGKPLVKADGPFKGYYISTTSYVYSGQRDDVQERYVNANIVPYSVLSEVSRKALGLKLGDLVHVKNTKNGKEKWTAYLETRFADDKIGEVSGAAANALGINSDPRVGGVGGGLVFTFYPNTAPLSNFKNDAEARHYIHRNGKNIEAGLPVDRNPRIPE
ncbi:MAG: hypothetical protein JNL70_07440 [Saprospiraceae bacterium]|nr:hypothetical protein [Saprospiraceae bacterium]